MNIIPVLSQRMKAYSLLLLEGLILMFILYAFWHHTGPQTPIRESWLWLLWLAVPIFWLRLRIHGRLWTETPLNDFLIAFILLTAFNFSNAPFHREGYLVIVGRPFFGIWLYLYFLEVANVTRRLTLLVIMTMGMGFVLGLLALTTTQWLPEKAEALSFIMNWLPHFDYHAAADSIDGEICSPFMALLNRATCFNPGDIVRSLQISFNPNEIAGALAWVTPIMAAIAIGYPDESKNDEGRDWINLTIRAAAAIVFVMLFLALFLGQSRFAIFGVIISLILLVWVLIPKGIWRYISLGVIGFIILLQLALIFNVFSPSDDTGLTGRDQNSVSTRLEIWNRGWQMMLDYPATGVGMGMYRTAVNRPPYQIDYYIGKFPPPHAHNEWIQMGADLGIPGFILYLSWQAAVVYMLWYGWRNGDKTAQVIAIATFAGLLGHAAYGFGDAVTLWDRYQFVLWWLIGLAGAQYVLVKSEEEFSLLELDES